MFLAQVPDQLEICIIIAGVSIYGLVMMVKRAASNQKPSARKGARYPRLNQGPQQDRLESLRRALGVDPAPTARRRPPPLAHSSAPRPVKPARTPLAPEIIPLRTSSAAPTAGKDDTFELARRKRQAENSIEDEFEASREAYAEKKDALKSAEYLRQRMGELKLNAAQQMVVYSEIFRPVHTRKMALPFEKTVL